MTVMGIIFLVSFVSILGWDAYLAYTGGFDATLSWWMYTNSIQYPIIPWAIGLVMGVLGGHFFWDQTLNVTVK